MKKIKLITVRLLIEPLYDNDTLFILELVNTEGWIHFIGNRNISSETDAAAYIQKINCNPHVLYFTVKLRDKNQPIGIITFIKRDYLEHHDIGFAFLPSFSGKGYAYEATKEVLSFLIKNQHHVQILAITLPENLKSIVLLKKLGLKFEKSLNIAGENLQLYSSFTQDLTI